MRGKERTKEHSIIIDKKTVVSFPCFLKHFIIVHSAFFIILLFDNRVKFE